MNSWCPRGRQL